MTITPLNFLIRNRPTECHQVVNTIAAANPAGLVKKVLKLPVGEPFVHSLYYPTNTKVRDDFSYLAAVDPEILAEVRHGQGLLMIDSSGEGGPATPEIVSSLHQRLASLDISPRRLIFVTQNTRFAEDYAAWADQNDVQDRFAVDEYHCYLRQMASYVEKEMIPDGTYQARLDHFLAGETLRDREFLTLTFTPRPHRIAFMLYLLAKGYLDRGLVSFPGLKNWKLDLVDRAEGLIARLPFPDMAKLKARLPDLAALGALTLDTDPAGKVTPIVDIGQSWYYEQSYFSLVTESGIITKAAHRQARFRRFTEKPFKPILGFHPFVSISWPFTLAEIRRYGFKTFSPWIDESYDDIEDDAKRMTAVMAEIDRLMALSHDEKRELRVALREVLLHNYQRFNGPLQAWFHTEMEAPLIARWRDLAVARVGGAVAP